MSGLNCATCVDHDALGALLATVPGTLAEVEPNQWQLETPQGRLLVLANPGSDWLRALLPIAPQADATPLLAELLECNFDLTRESRFALYQGVLWAIWQHRLSTLTPEDLASAIAQLQALYSSGLQQAFERVADRKLRQIVQVLRAEAKTLPEALQLLERLYGEGVLGTLQASREDRERTLGIWREKLTRLWQQGGSDSP